MPTWSDIITWLGGLPPHQALVDLANLLGASPAGTQTQVRDHLLSYIASSYNMQDVVPQNVADIVTNNPAPAPAAPPAPVHPAPAAPPPPGPVVDEPWYRNRGNLAALGALVALVLLIGFLWNQLNDDEGDNGPDEATPTTLVSDEDPTSTTVAEGDSDDEGDDEGDSDGSSDSDDDEDADSDNEDDSDDSNESNNADGDFPTPGNLDSMDKTVIEMAEPNTWFHRVFNERLFNEANDWGGADSWFVTLALGEHDGGNWTDHGNTGQIVYRGEETHLEWTLGMLMTSAHKDEFMVGEDGPAAVNIRIAPNSTVTVVTASGQTKTQDTSDMGDLTIILPDDGTITISVDYTTAAPTHESLVWWGPYDRSEDINTLDARS